MSIRKRKSFKQLPTNVKVIWSICLVFAVIGLSLTILDITEVIEDVHMIGTAFCSLSCLTSALMMTGYKDQLYEEE